MYFQKYASLLRINFIRSVQRTRKISGVLAINCMNTGFEGF